MPVKTSNKAALRVENDELRARLEEVEQTLLAIRTDVVDAFVIETARGPQVFVLQGLDRDSSRFREVILEHIRDAVVVTDESARIFYLNGAAERLYGVGLSDALAMRLLDLYEYRWSNPAEAVEAATTLSATGAWRGEQVHVKHDGEEIEVEISISVLPTGEDERTYTLMVIRDASALRRSERGRALLEARLQESEQWQAVGSLAARVISRGAADPIPSPEAVELARRVAAFGGQRPGREPLVSIPSIVDEFARLLRAGPGRTRRVECTSAHDTPFVHGDAMLLLQVLLCLGNNAADAMRGRAGPIVIRASGTTLGGTSMPQETELPEGLYARIEVSDTGPGIDLATRRRLFEPRFTTKSAGKSAGLGLAEVRQAMRAYGGDVLVHSVPGRGSRVEMFLPAG